MERKLAEAIVDDIIEDIHGRKGIGNEWDEIDADIREDIRMTWIEIVMARRV